jgi:hypothetical protein
MAICGCHWCCFYQGLVLDAVHDCVDNSHPLYGLSSVKVPCVPDMSCVLQQHQTDCQGGKLILVAEGKAARVIGLLKGQTTWGS